MDHPTMPPPPPVADRLVMCLLRQRNAIALRDVASFGKACHSFLSAVHRVMSTELLNISVSSHPEGRVVVNGISFSCRQKASSFFKFFRSSGGLALRSVDMSSYEHEDGDDLFKHVVLFIASKGGVFNLGLPFCCEDHSSCISLLHDLSLNVVERLPSSGLLHLHKERTLARISLRPFCFWRAAASLTHSQGTQRFIFEAVDDMKKLIRAFPRTREIEFLSSDVHRMDQSLFYEMIRACRPDSIIFCSSSCREQYMFASDMAFAYIWKGPEIVGKASIASLRFECMHSTKPSGLNASVIASQLRRYFIVDKMTLVFPHAIDQGDDVVGLLEDCCLFHHRGSLPDNSSIYINAPGQGGSILTNPLRDRLLSSGIRLDSIESFSDKNGQRVEIHAKTLGGRIHIKVDS